jgi:hypothetical protein
MLRAEVHGQWVMAGSDRLPYRIEYVLLTLRPPDNMHTYEQ